MRSRARRSEPARSRVVARRWASKVHSTSERWSNMRELQGLIRVMANGGPYELIAGILRREGFTPAACDDVEAIGASAARDDSFGVVLWVDGAVSSVRDLIEQLTRRCAHGRIVVICESDERWEVRCALAAGAAGVVVHAALDSCLGPSVRAVQVGQLCVPQARWRQVHPPALSTREKQILGLVVMGYMNSQIARQLVLAESTIKSHLSSAFAKLGVRSRNEAVDLIADPERGFGVGILEISGDRLQVPSTATS